MLTSIAVTPAEHAARCNALLAEAHATGLSGVVLFDPYYVLYYAGFAFVPTERPIALVLGADGTRTLVVPRLELEPDLLPARPRESDHPGLARYAWATRAGGRTSDERSDDGASHDRPLDRR